MRRLSSRHIFAAAILLFELPILAPIIVCALVTGLIAAAAERLVAVRTTLENIPLPDVTIRHRYSAPI